MAAGFNCALILVASLFVLAACKPTLTPEQKEQLASLQRERAAVQAGISEAAAESSNYAGGLIKTLIFVRLEVLKTNDALLQQRIHALEGNAKTEVVVKQATTDSGRAKALAAEIEVQRAKLAEARAESERYSGGLIKALAETTVATAANTVAMLEQGRLMAEYGLALPGVPLAEAERPSEAIRPQAQPVTPPSPRPSVADCLKIETFDSSVLSSNNTFTEVAWKADVLNSCSESFNVRVVFKLYDKDEFELDSDSESLHVPASSTGKARGKMLVSPPEKARRMARQGVTLSR